MQSPGTVLKCFVALLFAVHAQHIIFEQGTGGSHSQPIQQEGTDLNEWTLTLTKPYTTLYHAEIIV